ncbi:hypothetical protein HAX54_019499 [Datura stramonium]|uniref:Uncharacterized protein n=1 Tax=Datura stramonium TaxID=4076 RepID=A0ABS8S2L1_DATST|nr:hypothetical protein [Datura stramonium]
MVAFAAHVLTTMSAAASLRGTPAPAEDDDQTDDHSIIDRIYVINGRQNKLDSSYEATTTMEKKDTTWSSTTLEQEGAYSHPFSETEQVHDDIIIGSNEFQEAVNGILEDITVDVPHDW